MKLKDTPWKESYDQPRQHIKKQRRYFTNKGPSSQGYGFSSSHGWMWELDYKESWVPKSWCFWTVVLEKTAESPLDCKEIQPVHPKGDQSWIFIGRTDVEAETPTLCPPDMKSWLIWKDPDAGKDWRWEEKGTSEDETVGWHHWLNGHEFGWTPGVGDRQGSLACCSPWSQRVGHDWVTELTELNHSLRRRGEKGWGKSSIWIFEKIMTDERRQSTSSGQQIPSWTKRKSHQDKSCCCSGIKSCLTLCNPWAAACQATLPSPISQSLLKFMSIELLMLSNHLILCRLLLLLPSVFPCIKVFSNEWHFASHDQIIGASPSVSFLPMNIQDWFSWGLTGLISLQPKELSKIFSSTTIQKHQFSSTQLSLWSNSHIRTWLLEKP